MRRWKLLVLVMLALVAGVLSALAGIKRDGERGGVHNGPWRTSEQFGSRDAGMYTRAGVAIAGLFALSKSEAVYFVATTDSSGDPLRAACRYRITGTSLDARWWSLTVYGSDHYLLANRLDRFSFNIRNVAYDDAGGFEFVAARQPPSEGTEQWLPTGRQDDTLTLVLRVYRPSPEVYGNLDTVALPRIERMEAC